MFVDKDDKSDERSLQEALGKSAELWNRIRLHIEDKYGRTDEEWKHYGQSSGWTLKVLLKKRNLFFLMPHKGYFRIAFIFGERAVAAIDKSDLPDSIKKDLAGARKYAEGRGIRLEVKRPQDVRNVIKLVDIKIGF